MNQDFLSLNKKQLGKIKHKKYKRQQVKVAATFLIFCEFVILMRYEMRQFKRWTLPITLFVFLQKKVRRVKHCEILEFSQKSTLSFAKN